MFNELINKITVDIKTKEGRSRSMPTNENIAFKHAVTHLLKDLWKAFKSIPVRECLINCKSGYYSENSRYRDPNLNYQQMEAAFNGLIKLGLIEITKSNSLGQKEMIEDVTCFIATDELIDRFKSLRGHPAIILTPDLNKETIILGNTINGHKEAIDYKDTPKTEDYRDNLRMINQRLIRHWADLKIKDSEIPILDLSKKNALPILNPNLPKFGFDYDDVKKNLILDGKYGVINFKLTGNNCKKDKNIKIDFEPFYNDSFLESDFEIEMNYKKKNIELTNNTIHFKFNCISNYTNHLKITSNKLFSQLDKKIGLNRLKRSILINSIIIY